MRSETAAGGDSDSVPYCDRPGRGMLAVAAAPVSCVRSAAANRRLVAVKIFACVSVFACAGNTRVFHDSRFGVLLSASRLGAIRESTNSVCRRRRSFDGPAPAPPAPSRQGTAPPPLDACRRHRCRPQPRQHPRRRAGGKQHCHSPAGGRDGSVATRLRRDSGPQRLAPSPRHAHHTPPTSRPDPAYAPPFRNRPVATIPVGSPPNATIATTRRTKAQ